MSRLQVLLINVTSLCWYIIDIEYFWTLNSVNGCYFTFKGTYLNTQHTMYVMKNFTNTLNNSIAAYPPWMAYTDQLAMLLLFLEIVTLIFIILGNGLTIVVLIKKVPFPEGTNKIITSLTVADLLVGIAMAWNLIYQKHFAYLQTDNSCCSFGVLVHDHVMDIPALCSISNILVMSVDRYVAITKPLHYNLIMTPSRIAKILIAAWTIPIVYSSTYYFWWLQGNTEIVPLIYRMPLNLTCFFFVGIFLFYSNIRIMLIARQQRRRIHQQQISLNTVNTNHGCPMHQKNNTNNMMIYVVSAYFLAWLPVLILLAIINLLHLTFNNKLTLYLLLQYSEVLGYSNSGWNILIYINNSKKMRMAYKQVLFRYRNSQHRPDDSQISSIRVVGFTWTN